MTTARNRQQLLEAAVDDWIGPDPLLDDDTTERLAQEMILSDSRPLPDVTLEELTPIMRRFMARRRAEPPR